MTSATPPIMHMRKPRNSFLPPTTQSRFYDTASFSFLKVPRSEASSDSQFFTKAPHFDVACLFLAKQKSGLDEFLPIYHGTQLDFSSNTRAETLILLSM